MLVPPTVDHSDDWLIVHGDENQLAQEEAEFEEKVLGYAILCQSFSISYPLVRCRLLC